MDGKVRENIIFVWFLPLALTTVPKHIVTPCIGMCSIQQNKPRSNRRSIRREKANGKSALQSLFKGTTTIDFVMGNSIKTERTSRKGERKKLVQVNREAQLQRTVSTRGSLLLLLLPRSGWAGAEI